MRLWPPPTPCIFHETKLEFPFTPSSACPGELHRHLLLSFFPGSSFLSLLTHPAVHPLAFRRSRRLGRSSRRSLSLLGLLTLSCFEIWRCNTTPIKTNAETMAKKTVLFCRETILWEATSLYLVSMSRIFLGLDTVNLEQSWKPENLAEHALK